MNFAQILRENASQNILLDYNEYNEAHRKGENIMNFTENLENAKNFAVETALAAKEKAVQLAAIAKANIAIYAEEDKIKKAEQQLGQLYYRDYAVGEEMDSAEYLPWCNKIDESNKLIAELRERIEQLRASESEEPVEAETAEPEQTPAEEPAEPEAPAAEAPAAEAPAEEPAAVEAPAGEAPAEEAEIEIHIEPKHDDAE